MSLQNLRNEIGNTDLDLLDLVLGKKVDLFKNILDAGCGEGRNMGIFAANNIPVFGVDNDRSSVRMCRMHMKSLSSDFNSERVIHAAIEDEKVFPPHSFGFIFSIAVLHHCSGHDHFRAILGKLHQYLRPEGKLFIKMAALSGIADTVAERRDGMYRMPDLSVRYLFSTETERMLSGHFTVETKNFRLIPGERNDVCVLMKPKNK
jgi:tellurite methyltransferase